VIFFENFLLKKRKTPGNLKQSQPMKSTFS
jgi:hypothetical protein